MAPTTRRREGNGGQAAAGGAGGKRNNNGDVAAAAAATKRQRRPSTTRATAATSTPTTPTTTASLLTAAEAVDARELEELGGIDPATSFLYTPRTLTGLVIGIALLVYYTGAFSSNGGGGGGDAEQNADPAEGRRRGLVAALATWLLYCLLQGSPRMPLLRPHPAVWRLVHGAAVAYLLVLVWLLCQTASGARGALALLYPELGRPLPERSYGGDCGLLRRKEPPASGLLDAARPLEPSSSFFSPSFSSVSSSLFPSFPFEPNYEAVKSTLLDEFVVAHALGWWAKAVLIRDRRLLWPLSVGFELAEASLAHALPNFNECWWDSWVLDVAVCNFVGMELGMATAALLGRWEGPDREWGGVSTRRGALAKAKRVAAQFSPRSWEGRDWAPGGSPRRAGWALFLLAAFLLFDLNSFFLKAALWVPQLNPLTVYRLVGFFLLGLPAFKEFYRFVVVGEERAAAAAEEEGRERKREREREREREQERERERRGNPSREGPRLSPPPLPANRLGPCAWLMLAIIAAETLVAVKFGPRLLPGGVFEGGLRGIPRSVARAWGAFGAAAAGLAGSWLWSGWKEAKKRRAGGEGEGVKRGE